MGMRESDFRHLIGQNAAILGGVKPIPGPSMQAPMEPAGEFTAEGAEALEHADQARLAAVLDAAGLLWNHCPNEGKRPGRTGRTLLGHGLKPGWPDVLIATPAADGRSTVLELKRVGLRPKRPLPAGVPPWSPSCFTVVQRRTLERFAALGWHALVAYGAEGAVEQLRAIGYPLGEVER